MIFQIRRKKSKVEACVKFRDSGKFDGFSGFCKNSNVFLRRLKNTRFHPGSGLELPLMFRVAVNFNGFDGRNQCCINRLRVAGSGPSALQNGGQWMEGNRSKME